MRMLKLDGSRILLASKGIRSQMIDTALLNLIVTLYP